MHEKIIKSGGKEYRIGAIAEVCVHPRFRKRGFVKKTLAAIHEWLARGGFPFAVLFGDPKVYTSSGYLKANNVFHDAKKDSGEKYQKKVTVLYRKLSDTPWPHGEAYLPGPEF